MQTENRIQLNYTVDHGIDYKKCPLKVREGRVAVEMLPASESVSGILLPDKVGANLRPDVGAVVASGTSLGLGKLVCVRPYDGVWISEPTGYETKNEVRVYGAYAKFQGQPVKTNWYDSIVCEIEEGHLRATGNNIIIKRDPIAETQNGIYLPDSATTRGAMATVVSVGPKVKDLKEGDRVCYCPKMIAEAGLQFDLNEDAKDFAVCDELAINYVLEMAA